MICDSCGYRNENNQNSKYNKNCISCGAVLKPMPSESQISETLNRLSDNSDALTATPFEKKIKWLFFVSSVIILIVISVLLKNILMGIMIAFPPALAGICAGYPKVIWMLEKRQLRFRLMYNGEVTPSDWWGISRKISYWLLYICSIILVLIIIYSA